MKERTTQIVERQRRLNDLYPTALLITGTDGWKAAELTEKDLHMASIKVSLMIAEYNRINNNEMLPKSPDVIRDQMEANRSIMVVHRKNGHIEVICHGTIYPALEEEESRALGKQVYEVGSLIVSPGERGHGIGTLGNLMLLELASRNPDTVALATVKQQNTAASFKNAGMNPVSFWKHPYLSYLTCSCTHCSEREGHSFCDYRRNPQDSNIVALEHITDKTEVLPNMPCTLMINNPDSALAFERRCRDLHQKLRSQSIESVIPETMKDAMEEMRIFFQQLRNTHVQ